MLPKPAQTDLLPLPRISEDYSKTAHYPATPTSFVASLSRSVSNIPPAKHLSFPSVHRFADGWQSKI